MFLCTCKEKIRKGNKIVGYVLSDVNGKVYNVKSDELKEKIRNYEVLVDNLKLSVDGRLIDKKIENLEVICFHNPDEENAYLSNWYYSDFRVDNIKFTSMEQYMMYSKAVLFKDIDIANEILKTNDFKTIKSLGRQVRNFDDNIWDLNKESIIYKGLYAKFTQNEDLKEKLLSTNNKLLAECAVNDKVWGIGLSMKDPDRLKPFKWKGKGLLGKLLMQVREDIRFHK